MRTKKEEALFIILGFKEITTKKEDLNCLIEF
jgi:hypothetical protein